jgi:hypothetical protein
MQPPRMKLQAQTLADLLFTEANPCYLMPAYMLTNIISSASAHLRTWAGALAGSMPNCSCEPMRLRCTRSGQRQRSKNDARIAVLRRHPSKPSPQA